MTSNTGNTYLNKKPFTNHGNSHEPFFQWATDSSTIAYILISLISIYYLLDYFNILPFTLTQAVWRALVILTPSRIVFALDKKGTDQATDTSDITQTDSTDFRSKSEAMQRILGLDGTSLIPSFPRSRTYSTLSNALLGAAGTHPPGLGNWDNSCYQNSIIQGMASLRSLEGFLDCNIRALGHRHLLSTNMALKDTIDKLNDSTFGGRKLWIPSELKSMCSWQQQDAQEYFSKLVEQMDKEITHASKGITSDLGFKAPQRMDVRSENIPPTDREIEHGNNNVGASEDTKDTLSFNNPLEGLLAQRVGCMQCGWAEGLSLIPFNCLTVSLGRNWEYDVRECLDEYTALESIEGVECAKCTLLRTETQLQHLLKQMNPESDSGDVGESRELTEALKRSAETRLKAIRESLEDEDFSEKTLSGKCHIPPRNRVTSTKSKQVVVARAPKSLIMHVNRSVFDEMTGMLRKNYADVRFPKMLDLDEWCLGTKVGESENSPESWGIDPSESMLSDPGSRIQVLDRRYELRAVVTHYGRHENGHYICYRKYSTDSFPVAVPQTIVDADGEKAKADHWFRLSDEDVSPVSESDVIAQGGVFMLFYELVDQEPTNTDDGIKLSDEDGEPSKPQATRDDIPLQEIPRNLNYTMNEMQSTTTEAVKDDKETTSCSTDSPAIGSVSSPVSGYSGSSTSNSEATPVTNVHNVAPMMRTAKLHNTDKNDASSDGLSNLVPSPMVAAR